MDYYFSGIDDPNFLSILIKTNSSGMVNYKFMHQKRLADIIYTQENMEQLPLVLDSGAFQGNDNINDYAYKLKRYGWRYKWVANLDVLGNQDQSNKNYEKLCKVHPNLLWVYQVEGGYNHFHIREHAEEGDLIGVGGLVPLINRDLYQAIETIYRVGAVLEEIGATAHFFGVSSPDILTKFKTKSWFTSADSPNWLNGIRGQRCLNTNGEFTNFARAGYQFTGEELAAQNIRVYKKWIDPETKIELSLIRNLRRK